MWRKPEHKDLCMELYHEISNMAPGSRVSQRMRMKLEKICPIQLKCIVDQTYSGCSALFIACKRGLVEVVHYLHVKCGADLELKGLYDVPEDRTVHYVTPLWCAAVAGKLEVVKVLLSLGAQINTVSDTGSTPVRSACFMTNIDIVKCLVENGADIMRPNFNGGTCLINSVQSAKLCEYLLDHGADINAMDIKCKTPLHYAIEEFRYETVELLIKRGADPYIKSRLNDDALQTACAKGAFQIFNYLLHHLNLTDEQKANAHELLGATFLDELSDIHQAILHWRIATAIRYKAKITKAVMEPHKAFGYASEFTNSEELERTLLDHDSIRMQSLLICHRILGPEHKDTIFRIMYRGAAYADSCQFRRCIQLWLYAFELRIRKDTMLYSEVFTTAHALAKLFLDLLHKFSTDEIKIFIVFEDIFQAITLIGEEIERSQKLLMIKPEYNKHQQHFDQMLVIFLQFLYVVLRLELDTCQCDQLTYYIKQVLRLNPRTTHYQYTLLHLSVTKSLLLCSGNTAADNRPFCPFPNVKVTSFLLECGACVNAVDGKGASPLYYASLVRNFSKEMLNLLLQHGAHLDQATLKGDSPVNVLMNYYMDPSRDIVLPVLPLKCLSAQVIKSHRIPVKHGSVPQVLESFLELH